MTESFFSHIGQHTEVSIEHSDGSREMVTIHNFPPKILGGKKLIELQSITISL